MEAGNSKFTPKGKKMVSLISRSKYIEQLKSDEYSSALVDFLFNNEFIIDSKLNFSNANDVSLQALYAIKANNRNFFLEAYNQISRRKAKAESDWIYNDILMFAMTIGVCKFRIDNTWLLETLRIRISYSDNESKLNAQTFIDSLNNNMDSTNNCLTLMIVIKHYLGLPLGGSQYVNSAYREILKMDFSHSKGAFFNLFYLKAFDVILISKGLANFDLQKARDDFIGVFAQRNHQIAYVLWGVLTISVLAVSLWFLIYYLNVNAQQADIINRVMTVLSFLGLGGIIVPVVLKKKIINLTEKLIYRFYGYKLDQYIDRV